MNTFTLWVLDIAILAMFGFSLYWLQTQPSKLTKVVSFVAALLLGLVGIVLFFALVT